MFASFCALPHEKLQTVISDRI